MKAALETIVNRMQADGRLLLDLGQDGRSFWLIDFAKRTVEAAQGRGDASYLRIPEPSTWTELVSGQTTLTACILNGRAVVRGEPSAAQRFGRALGEAAA